MGKFEIRNSKFERLDRGVHTDEQGFARGWLFVACPVFGFDVSARPRLAHGARTAIISPLFMHPVLRSSLPIVAIVAIAALAGCQTHDRRIYSTHRDKNLHTPNPFAPSTTKAADEATSPIGLPPGPPNSPTPAAPPGPANP
jgi:hypothetical protein